MSEWHFRPLSELIINFDERRIPVKGGDRCQGHFPYYGASGIIDYTNKYLFDGEYLLIAEDGENLRTRNTPIAFLARGKFWVNNHAHVVQGNEQADTRFLMYAIQALDISGHLTGSTMPKLSQRSMNQILIHSPYIKEQQTIARILGSLDDKIELNRQMNATLEAMVRAIFKSWFMDFDPMRAKAMGGQPVGIDVETMAQLPEHFENSEIGEIPSGWKIERFEKIFRHSTERIGSEPAVEYSATVTGLTLRDERFNKQLSKTREKNKKIVKGDFVFGLSRKVVNFGLMKEKIGSVSPVYEIFKVNSDIYIPELLEMKIRYDMSNYIDILKPSAREGQGIDREYLLSKVVLVPDMQLQKKFFQIYSLLQQKIESNEQQSRTLARIRDALLPKLMSGEIQIKA